ncbi:hypothetical protein [Streptosporangium sp. KLBMP 9127]|nr:hypothetical protein [Streptosporangium sp. KLBMP 9127]
MLSRSVRPVVRPLTVAGYDGTLIVGRERLLCRHRQGAHPGVQAALASRAKA